MSLHPDAQKKAQAELDAVVGPDRLPRIKDYDRLPYINAVVKETLRWQIVAPLGVPHVSQEDDVYNGYFIPAGTILMANSWCALRPSRSIGCGSYIFYRAMVNDPSVYPDPKEFRPERFMKDGKFNPEVQDPGHFAFGYGRRYVGRARPCLSPFCG